MTSAAYRLVKMLSYADPIVALGLCLAVAASAYIAVEAYGAASFYSYVEPRYVSDEIYYVDVARRILLNMLSSLGVQVDPELWEFSGKTKEDYYNMEHPPLAKYIIALSMLICGDKPICWRLPSIAMGAATPLILWYGLYRAFGGRAGSLAGAIAALAVASDPVFRIMSSVAMLDIYQAFFTALSIALVLSGRPLPAAVAASMAALSKFSGGAAVLAVISVAARRWGLYTAFKMVLASILVALAVYLPLIIYFGPAYVVLETYSGILWHATPRPEGPPTSSPVGWILNSNPFYLSYSPLPLAAMTNTIMHAIAAAVAVSIFLGEVLGGRWPGVSHVYLVMTYMVYAAVMAAGNTTLYSFYAAQLTPAAAGVLGEVLGTVMRVGEARDSGSTGF